MVDQVEQGESADPSDRMCDLPLHERHAQQLFFVRGLTPFDHSRLKTDNIYCEQQDLLQFKSSLQPHVSHRALSMRSKLICALTTFVAGYDSATDPHPPTPGALRVNSSLEVAELIAIIVKERYLKGVQVAKRGTTFSYSSASKLPAAEPGLQPNQEEQHVHTRLSIDGSELEFTESNARWTAHVSLLAIKRIVLSAGRQPPIVCSGLIAS